MKKRKCCGPRSPAQQRAWQLFLLAGIIKQLKKEFPASSIKTSIAALELLQEATQSTTL